MKGAAFDRDALAAKVRAALEDSAALFEARWRSASAEGEGVDWLADVVEGVARAAATSRARSEAEAVAGLADEAGLARLVGDELEAHGVEGSEAAAVARLVRGVLLAMDARHGAVACPELARWLYSGMDEVQVEENDVPAADARLAQVHVGGDELGAMRAAQTPGTLRLLGTANAGNCHSMLSEALAFELLHRLLGGRLALHKTEMEIEYDERVSHSSPPRLSFLFSPSLLSLPSPTLPSSRWAASAWASASPARAAASLTRRRRPR